MKRQPRPVSRTVLSVSLPVKPDWVNANRAAGMTGATLSAFVREAVRLHAQRILDARMRGRKRLEVIVHELLHALNPTQSEEHVEQQGKDIARVLWTLGYREVSDGKGND